MHNNLMKFVQLKQKREYNHQPSECYHLARHKTFKLLFDNGPGIHLRSKASSKRDKMCSLSSRRPRPTTTQLPIRVALCSIFKKVSVVPQVVGDTDCALCRREQIGFEEQSNFGAIGMGRGSVGNWWYGFWVLGRYPKLESTPIVSLIWKAKINWVLLSFAETLQDCNRVLAIYHKPALAWISLISVVWSIWFNPICICMQFADVEEFLTK